MAPVDGRELDETMRQWAAAQHSLVTRDQLRRVGATRQAMAARLRSPDWEAVTPRVLRLVGAAVTDRQRAMAAVLDAGAGAAVSHATAAALWDLPGFGIGRIELSRSRHGSRRATTLARVHHPRSLPDRHVTTRSGIPVTTLARTVVDLGATEHPARVELALHAAIRLGMTWSAVETVVEELAERGRTGVPVARALVGHDRQGPPLGSGLEGTVRRLLVDAGLPEPRRQVDLGAGEWVGQVDFFYEDVGLVIEVDGGWNHEGALDVRRDKRRTAALVAAGFRVLPLSEDLIRSSPHEVVRLVKEARRRPAGRTGPPNDIRPMSFPTPEPPAGPAPEPPAGPAAGPADADAADAAAGAVGAAQRPILPPARFSAMAQPKAMR